MVQPKFDREVNKGSELKLSTPCLPMQSLEQAATRDGRAKLDLGANRPRHTGASLKTNVMTRCQSWRFDGHGGTEKES